VLANAVNASASSSSLKKFYNRTTTPESLTRWAIPDNDGSNSGVTQLYIRRGLLGNNARTLDAALIVRRVGLLKDVGTPSYASMS